MKAQSHHFRHVLVLALMGALISWACSLSSLSSLYHGTLTATPNTLSTPKESHGQTPISPLATLESLVATPGASGAPEEGGTQMPGGGSAVEIPSSEPPSGEGLLPSLEAWRPWRQPGSLVAGKNSVSFIEDPLYGRVALLSRTDGGNDGGGAGLTITPRLDVSGYQHLYVHVMGKILAERGGNIANVNPQWYPEGALQVRVHYLAADGEEHEWYHGFYHATSGQPDARHFTRQPLGEWFSWNSRDLMGLPARPVRIVWVRVYGFGWGFRSEVAAVELIGQKEEGTGEGQYTGACRYVTTVDTPVFFYPSEDAEQFGVLPANMPVEVEATTPDRTWVAFTPAVPQACNVGPFRLRWAKVSQTGRVEGNCTAVPGITPPPQNVCFVAGVATVYASPSTTAQVLGNLGLEDYVGVLGEGPDGWLKVDLETGHSTLTGEGWVQMSEVCFQGVGPCENLPPVP